jgi:hypothetical protein
MHEDVWGNGDIAPQFLTLSLGGDEWSASHSYHVMDMMIGGPQLFYVNTHIC